MFTILIQYQKLCQQILQIIVTKFNLQFLYTSKLYEINILVYFITSMYMVQYMTTVSHITNELVYTIYDMNFNN